MFKFLSAPKNTARPLTEQETGYIESLKGFLNAYQRRSYLTVFTGDKVVKDSEGNEVDRTAQKTKVAQDLITHIQENGCENLRIAFLKIAENHHLDAFGFTAGKTEKLLDNKALFDLLNEPQISTATLAEDTQYAGKTAPIAAIAPK